MLTNYDLEDLCEDYDVRLNEICMKDQLPKQIKNGNYIINLESSMGGKNSGTHWTTLTILGRNAFFYDPYGAPPSVEIREFVKRRPKTKLGFNNWVIQDIKSENCGYFCVSLLIYLNPWHMYESANNYINQFVDNTKENDELLKRSFKILKKSPTPQLIKRLYNIK
jgi:hypothetical protein